MSSNRCWVLRASSSSCWRASPPAAAVTRQVVTRSSITGTGIWATRWLAARHEDVRHPVVGVADV